MTQETGTVSSKKTATLWQKIAGGALAARWSQQEKPPVGPDKAGFYAVALASGVLNDEDRGRVARCLVLCDFNRSAFDPARFGWYKTAFLAYPDDEDCAFFVASLCIGKEFSDPDLAMTAYRKVLQPEWKSSRFWKRFSLSKRALLIELAALYAAQPAEGASAGVIEVVEAALDILGEEHPSRHALISFLCRAYQMQGRKDEYAESAYRWVFNRVPDNVANCRYLAELYRERGIPDNNACVVYTHMASLADKEGNKAEADQWILHLAHAYIQLGQINSDCLPVFERAEKFKPDDKSVAAACLYARAHQYATADAETAAAREGHEDQVIITILEEALTRELELRPVFESHGLEWTAILRALALAYGHQNRADAAAQSLYARAIWACPEDVAVWALHAATLAERKDYSESALTVYEKVIHEPDCSEAVFTALAHTYIGVRAEKDKTRRLGAMAVWEHLYQKGVHWPEMVNALAEVYMSEGRVNDTAVSLWEKQAVSSPRNGRLKLRLAQELRLRGDLYASARYYQEAAKLLPKDFDAQFETGLVLKDTYADYTNAIRLLDKAVRMPKGLKHLDAHFALAEALLFCDKRAEAKDIFQKIIDDIDPEHTPSLLYLAKLNLKYEEEGARLAEALYTQASTLSPNNPEAYKGMADLYREKGQSDDEEQALEKYLMLSEPDGIRYRQLADLYIRKGDFLRAESALRQVIALGQGDKKLYVLLGEVILQGRGREAA